MSLIRPLHRCIAVMTLFTAVFAAAQGPPGGGPPPPPEVSVITVAATTVPVSFEFVGVTQASKTVEVRARVQGFLDSRDFEEGAVVDEGTTLFTIDPRSFKADLQIANARVDQSEARLRLAEQEVKRLESVKVPGAIAQSDLDKQVAEQVNAAAALRLAKAEIAKAELELSYTTVKAPLTGYIGKALKEMGSLVDAGQNSLLAVMYQVDPIYVSFPVSEREFLDWQRDVASGKLVLSEGGRPYLQITLLDGEEYSERGDIDFMDVAVETRTGSVGVRGTFPNPEKQLKPGQFVKAYIKGYSRPDTITVPQRAVAQSPQTAYVYVVGADSKAEMRPITPGKWSGTDWIIEKGLAPGDQVVVEGLVKVQPGIVVHPVPLAELPSAQPAH